MDDSRLTNVTQLKEFLKASQGMAVSLEEANIEEKYSFIVGCTPYTKNIF